MTSVQLNPAAMPTTSSQSQPAAGYATPAFSGMADAVSFGWSGHNALLQKHPADRIPALAEYIVSQFADVDGSREASRLNLPEIAWAWSAMSKALVTLSPPKRVEVLAKAYRDFATKSDALVPGSLSDVAVHTADFAHLVKGEAKQGISAVYSIPLLPHVIPGPFMANRDHVKRMDAFRNVLGQMPLTMSANQFGVLLQHQLVFWMMQELGRTNNQYKYYVNADKVGEVYETLDKAGKALAESEVHVRDDMANLLSEAKDKAVRRGVTVNEFKRYAELSDAVKKPIEDVLFVIETPQKFDKGIKGDKELWQRFQTWRTNRNTPAANP